MVELTECCSNLSGVNLHIVDVQDSQEQLGIVLGCPVDRFHSDRHGVGAEVKESCQQLSRIFKRLRRTCENDGRIGEVELRITNCDVVYETKSIWTYQGS